MLKKLTRMAGLALALCMIGTTAPMAACEAEAPTVSCSDAPCLMPGQTAWFIEWNDQSGCNCDEILIYADQDCNGGWTHVATLGCSATDYTFCGDASSDYKFKIVYMNNGNQTVNDIVTSCLDCP